MKLNITTLSLLLILCYNLIGQNSLTPTYIVKSYSKKDGMLSNQPSRVFQDDNGYLWVCYYDKPWQIFDDKVFIKINNNNSFGYNSENIISSTGKNIFCYARNGYYKIHNYYSKLYRIPNDLFETKNTIFGYSNPNKVCFTKKGELLIIKRYYKKTVDQFSLDWTVNDTIFKIDGNKIETILIDNFKNDSSITLDFHSDNKKNVWISATSQEKGTTTMYLFENNKLKKTYSDLNSPPTFTLTDDYGNNWFCGSYTEKETFIYRYNKGRCYKYSLGSQVKIGDKGVIDKLGNLWITNLNGLIKINPSSSKITFFYDKKREIKENVSVIFDDGRLQSMIEKITDQNYYQIAINQNDEIFVGDKLFTEDKGFIQILQKQEIKENSLTSLFVDKENNIWYAGDGLLKLTKSHKETTTIPGENRIKYVTKNKTIFSEIFREKLKKTIIYAHSIHGELLDSIITEPYVGGYLNFIEFKGGIFIIIDEFQSKWMLFNKNNKFERTTIDKLNKSNNKIKYTHEHFNYFILDNDSNLLLYNNNNYYKLENNYFKNISSTLKNKPNFNSNIGPLKKYDFSGFIDSIGIYKLKENRFDFTKLPFSSNESSIDYYIPINLNKSISNLLIIYPNKKEAFTYINSKLTKLKINGCDTEEKLKIYTPMSCWLNDTIFIGCYNGGTAKYLLDKNKTTLNIKNLNSKQEGTKEGYYHTTPSFVFYTTGFDNNVYYFPTNELDSEYFNEYIIPNSEIDLEFSSYIFSTDNNYVFFSKNQKNHLINLSKFRLNKNEPILNFINLSYFKNDSMVTYNFEKDSLQIPYDFNPLKIHFKGITLIDGKKVTYKYKLLGMDKDWQETNEDYVTYTSLPPGIYTFQVISCNGENQWNKHPKQFTFIVTPPFYKTWWAYIIYAFLLVAIGYSILKIRTKKLQKEKEKLEAIISERTAEVIEQKHVIEEKHKEITDSINYAERIQRSFLATKELLNANLKEYFVLFQPKDVVSGDFYWATKLNNGDFLLATADSTGHGVPGAIMSILNISCLEKAVNEGITDPAETLNHTRTNIIERLKKDGSEEGGKDGMDCSLICLNPYSNNLRYSAANNPIWVVRNGELIELAPDKMPVGKHDKDANSFKSSSFELQSNDMIYTITDGFPDQFGGPKGKKFMYKQLKELLVAISHLPSTSQKEKLFQSLINWKGNIEQVDDICIIGIRYS